MELREFAMSKEFYNKKGKQLVHELDDILMEYCKKNKFKLTENDEEFIDEWFLRDSYKLWKYQYDHGVITL